MVSKLLEKHIYALLLQHLIENSLLSESQWGFTSGKSTVTALLSTFYNILQLLESGYDVSLIFFDLKKAFDSVPHLPLLNKLKEIGVNQHILQWITSYLYERKQNVVVDGASSVPVPVLSGVPQGSVLGPLLFLTYINQVTALNLSEGTHMADDILLFKPITCTEDYASLQLI